MNIFDHRRQQFRQLYNYLGGNPDSYKSVRTEQNEDVLVLLAKLRVIPARNTNYSLNKISETWDYYTDYNLQLFVSTLEEAVIENDWTEATVREKLSAVEDRLNSHPNRDYPADGSKGQAKAAMKAKRNAYKWLLGEYHGEPLDDADKLTGDERTDNNQLVL